MKSLLFIFLVFCAVSATAQPFADSIKNQSVKNTDDKADNELDSANALQSSGIPVDSNNSPVKDWQRLWVNYAGIAAGYTSNETVPFWMRSNKFGSTPLYGASASILLSIAKEYDTAKKKNKLDWGMGMEWRFNMGYKVEAIPVQGYLKGRWGAFQLKAGRSKDIMGLVDSTLGMGAFAMSGNALGVPKVELSFPDFWNIPILWRVLSVKGNFSIGWLGETSIAPAPISGGADHRQYGVSSVNTMFHQKSLYLRFGKPSWRIHFFGGINHQTEFGNEEKIYKDFNLSNIESFYYAMTGKTWFANNGFSTKLGNQLGSIDFAGKYRFDKFTVYAYHQFFYDVGALGHLANLRDGLTGISFTNNVSYESGFHLKKVLFEYFYSKDQAGEVSSRPTPSGDEDYYNNYLYVLGWSYKDAAIGNPFITPRIEAKSGQVSQANQFFINNRVIACHFAADFQVGKVDITTKLSYSENFGTFATSSIGYPAGNTRIVMPPPYFQPVNQFSGYIECSRFINKKWMAEFTLASDFGELLYNSTGIGLGLKRFF